MRDKNSGRCRRMCRLCTTPGKVIAVCSIITFIFSRLSGSSRRMESQDSVVVMFPSSSSLHRFMKRLATYSLCTRYEVRNIQSRHEVETILLGFHGNNRKLNVRWLLYLTVSAADIKVCALVCCTDCFLKTIHVHNCNKSFSEFYFQHTIMQEWCCFKVRWFLLHE